MRLSHSHQKFSSKVEGQGLLLLLPALISNAAFYIAKDKLSLHSLIDGPQTK
jgi:hypothetical protein